MNEKSLAICAFLKSLPLAGEARSRFGKNDAFWVGNQEFLHFHSKSQIDIRLGAEEVSRRKKAKQNGFIFRKSRSDWVSVDIDTVNLDVIHSIIEIAYNLVAKGEYPGIG
jgi:hypothetical protein